MLTLEQSGTLWDSGECGRGGAGVYTKKDSWCGMRPGEV